MNEVTRILSDLQQGDRQAAGQLLPLVYEELRKLAAQRMATERPDHTLEATALVHEAYLRLVEAEKVPHWNSRGAASSRTKASDDHSQGLDAPADASKVLATPPGEGKMRPRSHIGASGVSSRRPSAV